MNIFIAIDSFKGSLSSLQAGKAAAEGILSVFPDAKITVSPLADGGEGTVDTMIGAMHGRKRTLTVTGPLGAPVEAAYGILGETKIAVIEMAAAAGITLVPEEKRNALYTTTFGVGEMIADAVHKGCRDFLIGIGGSATNDGGTGMLRALGAKFLDQNGNDIPLGAIGLSTLAEIRTDGLLKELSDCRFRVACDVKNPLCGENGCSAVFGPQKGLAAEYISLADAWLSDYAALTKTLSPASDAEKEGCGAAGGMGFAFLSYLSAELRSGIELVLDVTEAEKHIQEADIVLTGEGRLDGQSCMGKAPVGVAKLAKKHGKTVIALAGGVTEDAVQTHDHGIDAFFPIVRTPCTLAEAMQTENAYRNMRSTVREIFRLIKLC